MLFYCMHHACCTDEIGFADHDSANAQSKVKKCEHVGAFLILPTHRRFPSFQPVNVSCERMIHDCKYVFVNNI